MRKTVPTVQKPSKKNKPWQFQPGVCANPNGRPKGSRNKLSEAFICDLFADWEVAGSSAIQACRLDDPGAYLRVVASLVPKEFSIREGENHLEAIINQFDDQQLDQLIAGIVALGVAEKGKGQTVKALPRVEPDSVH